LCRRGFLGGKDLLALIVSLAARAAPWEQIGSSRVLPTALNRPDVRSTALN
jgi:hypothetical protein